ncbi:hypothetical protein EI017_25135, partial [Escherichia coli]|nr:hypothetical protein [Escherichia coli]
ISLFNFLLWDVVVNNMNSDTQPETPSYWCYSCTRYVHLLNHNNITCPHCESGFLEQIQPDPSSHHIPLSLSPDASTVTRHAFRRRRRNSSNRSPFNPVIVLRSPGHYAAGHHERRSNFDLYYD